MQQGPGCFREEMLVAVRLNLLGLLEVKWQGKDSCDLKGPLVVLE